MTDALRLLTETELAQALGKQARTVRRWHEQGCPRAEKDPPRYREADVRAWCTERGLNVTPPALPAEVTPNPAPQVASRATLARAELARKLTLAKRQELELTAERGLKDLDLGDRIRAAQTNQDLATISKEVGALLGTGSMSPSRGRAIQALLAEARHNLKEHREAEGDEDPQRLILVSEEGAELLEAFEWIVSDERRARVLAIARAEADQDAQDVSHVDTAQGLDPDGEPEEQP